MSEVLPFYFGLDNNRSFQRQLHVYGFKRLVSGIDKGGYYHPNFLRNRTFLLSRIERVPVKGTVVRMRTDPMREPDFWSMPWVDAPVDVSSCHVPLPDCTVDTAINPAMIARMLQPQQNIELFRDEELDQVLLFCRDHQCTRDLYQLESSSWRGDDSLIPRSHGFDMLHESNRQTG